LRKQFHEPSPSQPSNPINTHFLIAILNIIQPSITPLHYNTPSQPQYELLHCVEDLIHLYGFEAAKRMVQIDPGVREPCSVCQGCSADVVVDYSHATLSRASRRHRKQPPVPLKTNPSTSLVKTCCRTTSCRTHTTPPNRQVVSTPRDQHHQALTAITNGGADASTAKAALTQHPLLLYLQPAELEANVVALVRRADTDGVWAGDMVALIGSIPSMLRDDRGFAEVGFDVGLGLREP